MLSNCRQYLLTDHLSTTIDHLAALMITYPSTYGVFEEEIINIIDTGKQIGADWVEISGDCDNMIVIAIHVYPSIYVYYWSIHLSPPLSNYLIDNSSMPLCLIHPSIYSFIYVIIHLLISFISFIYLYLIHWFISFMYSLIYISFIDLSYLCIHLFIK